jgi:polar amino acid transport system substrate-binding protein
MQRDRIAYVGTVPFEPPLLYQKEGELVGPDAEIGRRMVQKIDETRETEGGTSVKLTWINRSYPNLIAALKNHEIDFILGVFGVTDSRKKEVDFSDSYYTSKLVFVVNPVQKDVAFSEIDSSKIGVREGTAVEEVVRGKYKNAKVEPYKTLDDAILALRRSEIDGVIDDEILASYSLATTPGAGYMEILPGEIASIDVAVAVKKGDKPLLALANGILAEMKQEAVYEKMIEEHGGPRFVQEITERRNKRLEEEKQASTPRSVLISVSKDADFNFDQYKLANLTFVFRNQETGVTIQTSPITFEGRVGKARASVPPGDYTLSQPRFNFSASVSIVPADKDNVPINIRLSSGGVVVRKG